MSTCSRKINEIKDRLDGFSGYSDLFIFKRLTKISLILYEIEDYVQDCEDYYKHYMEGLKWTL